MQDIYNQIRKIIAEHYGVDIKKITMDTWYLKDFNGTENDKQSIRGKIESKMALRIYPNMMNRFNKVRDLVKFIRARQNSKGRSRGMH